VGRIQPEAAKRILRPMVALLLVSFQILLLLLKAYFSKQDDKETELKRIADEQAKLNVAAEKVEESNRYSENNPAFMDQFQDAIDKDRFDATHSKPENNRPH
jgi:hypothetical protein